MGHLRTLDEFHLSTDGATYALQLRLGGGECVDVAIPPGQLNALGAAAERLAGSAVWASHDEVGDPWREGP
jgi:hypothetical protein